MFNSEMFEFFAILDATAPHPTNFTSARQRGKLGCFDV